MQEPIPATGANQDAPRGGSRAADPLSGYYKTQEALSATRIAGLERQNAELDKRIVYLKASFDEVRRNCALWRQPGNMAERLYNIAQAAIEQAERGTS